jgi:hypothetical protein
MAPGIPSSILAGFGGGNVKTILKQSPLVLTLLLLSAGGCSPYVDGLYFSPSPAVVELTKSGAPAQPGTQSPAPLTALATVVGVRREDSHENLPESIQIALRLENNGSQAVEFDPHTLQLMTGKLFVFPPPILRPAAPIQLAAGQTADFTAFFPFPSGVDYDSIDLNDLRLHWAIRIDNQVVSQSAEFQRVRTVYRGYYDPWGPPPPYYYYGRYWGPRVGIGVRF